MPTSQGGYVVLWIPANGLFYRGGEFTDGKMNPIGWDRTIKVYSTFSEAEQAKNSTLARFPDAKGELIIVPIKRCRSHGILD